MLRWLLLLALGPLLGAAPVDMGLERLKEQAILYAQSQADSAGGAYTFQVVETPRLLHLPKGQISFQADHLSKSDLTGRFFVVFRVLLDGRPTGMCRVDMEGHWKGTLLRAINALPRKTTPDMTQFESVPFEGTPPPGALTTLPEGFRLRLPVGVGHTLTRMDLEPIPLVSAGDRVRVEVAWGRVSISAEAIARGTGPAGSKIRLEMPGSRKLIDAIITGPGETRMVWMTAQP
nr:flagella basal body P-ring formation protein FlgA [uncultured Holophaga sp.]